MSAPNSEEIATTCPRAWLEQQFQKRHAKNPQYSQRAFAQTLGMGSGRLSQLLSNKRPFTPAIGEQICRGLKLSAVDTAEFLKLITSQRAVKRQDWRSSKIKTLAKAEVPSLQDLSEDQMAIIENPLYFTILSLMETVNFQSDEGWIATRLKRDVHDVRTALERMKRTSMIASRQDGTIERLNGPGFKTTNGIPSHAIRKAQRQIINQAGDALMTVPVEKRDVTSMIVAIDPKKIPEAKELIAEFRRKLTSLLESGDRTEVYSLSIQLSPLTDV